MKRTLRSVAALAMILVLTLACLPATAEEAVPQPVNVRGTTARELAPTIDNTLLCYPINLMGSGYNMSYYRFIAPSDGLHYFTLNVNWEYFTDEDGMDIPVIKNGSTFIIDLKAGDVVYFNHASQQTLYICNEGHHLRGEESYLTYPVSCTTDGEQAYLCQLCGTMFGHETIPATGHIPGDWGYYPAPTCTTPGAFGQICTDCGAVVNGVELPALGHAPSDTVVVLEPAGNQPGLMVVTCAECGETISTTVIPAVTE